MFRDGVLHLLRVLRVFPNRCNDMTFESFEILTGPINLGPVDVIDNATNLAKVA